MQDLADVDEYLRASTAWPDEIAAVRPILLACGLDEQIKWGKPCYSHDGANIVLMQEFSAFLALLFVKGVLLDDPAGALHEQGPNTHGPRRMQFTSVAQVDALSESIADYVHQAIAHEVAGTELPPRPPEALADELVERLAADDEFAEAFHALTPGRQREYNLHVIGAKRAETRERRIDQFLPRVLAGKGLRDR